VLFGLLSRQDVMLLPGLASDRDPPSSASPVAGVPGSRA
jgi:hypothetical protein